MQSLEEQRGWRPSPYGPVFGTCLPVYSLAMSTISRLLKWAGLVTHNLSVSAQTHTQRELEIRYDFNQVINSEMLQGRWGPQMDYD